jgi:hypothetical protein
MAFPVVEGRAESTTTTASTSHTVSLPASIASGNLLIVVIAAVDGTTTFSATGWTVGSTNTMTGATHTTAWLYKKADGTEGTTFTLTSSNSCRSAEVSYRISGAEDPATQVPQSTTASTTGNAVLNNPGANSPTGGSKDYLWISCFGQEGEEADDDTWVSTWNTSFTNTLEKTCGVAGAAAANCQVGSSERTSTTATMTLGGNIQTAQGLDARSYLIAIHPTGSTSANPTAGAVTAIAAVPAPTIEAFTPGFPAPQIVMSRRGPA